MIYNMVRTDGIFMLKHSDLELQNNLGKGNFGSVMRGTYRLRGKVIDVAVKVLKANDTAAEVRAVFCLCRTAVNRSNLNAVHQIYKQCNTYSLKMDMVY